MFPVYTLLIHVKIRVCHKISVEMYVLKIMSFVEYFEVIMYC